MTLLFIRWSWMWSTTPLPHIIYYQLVTLLLMYVLGLCTNYNNAYTGNTYYAGSYCSVYSQSCWAINYTGSKAKKYTGKSISFANTSQWVRSRASHSFCLVSPYCTERYLYMTSFKLLTLAVCANATSITDPPIFSIPVDLSQRLLANFWGISIFVLVQNVPSTFYHKRYLLQPK